MVFSSFVLHCLQEHTVRFVVKLLSLPIPKDYSGSESHLISYAPMLNSVLTGISSVDSVQIFSLQGLVGTVSAIIITATTTEKKVLEDPTFCVTLRLI